MDELLETLEVMQDKRLVKDLKAALREVEERKTRPFDELLRELHFEGKERQGFRQGSSSADTSQS